MVQVTSALLAIAAAAAGLAGVATETPAPTLARTLVTHSLISTQVTTPKETAPPPPTPAQVKQERKELLARVRVVLEASGCDVDKARKAGKNMVFVAAECGNVEALEMLVSAGAKIDAPATNGETPTHVARARGHAAAHAWLVARGGVATAPAKKKSSFSFSPKKLSPKKSPSK